MDIIDKIAIEDKVIVISDARAFFNGCIPGWKAYAEAHGFDWPRVVRHGLLASQLIATNDAMATSLVEYVYSRDDV